MPAASRNVKAAELPLKRKNAFRQITLSEDEINFSAIPLLLPVFPVSLPCRPHRIRINRLPCNGGIPVRVTRLCFRPDCSQVMASLPCCPLSPSGNSLKAHLHRKSCPVLSSILLQFDSIISQNFGLSTKKLDRTLFFTASS